MFPAKNIHIQRSCCSVSSLQPLQALIDADASDEMKNALTKHTTTSAVI